MFYRNITAQFYYGMHQEFGKNRIQHQTFAWMHYNFETFRIHYYEGGKELAEQLSHAINKTLPILLKKFNYQFDDKVDVLIYNNYGDFIQTNFGVSKEETEHIAAVTQIISDKILLYFKGSHIDLERQLRAGLTELIIDKVLNNSGLKELATKNASAKLPQWLQDGLKMYVSEGWHHENDNCLMDLIYYNKIEEVGKLSASNAAVLGCAYWFYLSELYGDNFVSDFIHLYKYFKDVDGVLLTLIDLTCEDIGVRLLNKFQTRYWENQDATRQTPKGLGLLHHTNNQYTHYQVKVKPDGTHIAYATRELGQIKVFIKNLETNNTHKILKINPKLERLDDPTYPLIQWHPENKIIAMIYENQNVIYFDTYHVDTKKNTKQSISGFEKITGFSFSNDGLNIVLSGVKKGKGQSDIFIYTLSSRGLEQITNDIWDDKNPIYFKNGHFILFESNRPHAFIKASDNALKNAFQTKYNDIYCYNNQTKSNELIKVTNSKRVNDLMPKEYSQNVISFLSDSNGIYNRWVGYMDSLISNIDTVIQYQYFFKNKVITNYSRHIIEHDINLYHSTLAEIIINNGKEAIFVSTLTPYDSLKKINTKATWLNNFTRKKFYDDNFFYTNNKDTLRTNSISKETFTNELAIKKQTALDGKEINGTLYFPMPSNYFTFFKLDNLNTQLDNATFNKAYQPFSGAQIPVILNNSANVLFKISASDLFENYQIVSGFRPSFNASFDMEFLLSFEDRRKRIDKKLTLHRQTTTILNTCNIIHDVSYTFKYPFSEVSALKLSSLYRFDLTNYLSNSDLNLRKASTYKNYTGLKLDYVYDDTRPRGLNLLLGTRLKTWVEYWIQTEIPKKDLITVGFDIRNYTKIHRLLIWCNRLAGSSSLGSEGVLFYLGSSDNWLLPSMHTDINIYNPSSYQFQTLATQLRGYKQNIRSGNNFVAFNSELRFPIYKYFASQASTSQVIENFQILAFTDIGMAWYGYNPYSDENIYNKQTIAGNPITSVINTLKEPFVGGLGLGARTSLFGYFIKVDYAWAIEKTKVKTEIFYLSLGLDF